MPLGKRTSQTHRGLTAAAARRPFHLRLPDVLADQKPGVTRAPELPPAQQAVANDPITKAHPELKYADSPRVEQAEPHLPEVETPLVQSTTSEPTGAQSAKAQSRQVQPSKVKPANVKSADLKSSRAQPVKSPSTNPQLSQARSSEKRYQEGHEQVTGIIERVRKRRRKLFNRLWVASIALTAISIMALAVELIQGMQSPATTRVAIPKRDKVDDQRQLVLKTPAPVPSPRDVSTAAAREWSNESPEDQPVKSALYTTEEGLKPQGAWLDGQISNPDSDSH